ncbi:MAG: pyrroline-5-carboxylate reductase [Actinobacteria bacterium]|jgi:pyrroline-5-carboxylate reductase|nr:MAG: pyrroline-5-carboxylate reductase [Actinomycetota bacterium]
MSRIAFIGAGKMAEAILKELLRVEWAGKESIVLSDVDRERLESMAVEYGTITTPSNPDAARDAEIVLLAVKPQKLEEVLRELSGVIDAGQLVISIAMGKSTEFIEALLPEGIPVVRVMPNNPAMVGAAVSVLSYGRHADEEARRRAKEVFSCLGEVYEIAEMLQDQAMAISGCGPAYFYVIAEALCDAGVRLGLDRSLARKLVTGTMIGAGTMMRDSGEHPAQLKDMVTSPGGSTIAALEALEEAGLRNAFYKAVAAAWRRAKEV